jgi:hypothetical protein
MWFFRHITHPILYWLGNLLNSCSIWAEKRLKNPSEAPEIRENTENGELANTISVVPDKINLKGLNKVYDDWHSSFVERFKGTPVRVDSNLEGGQYYIAVSQAVLKEVMPNANL